MRQFLFGLLAAALVYWGYSSWTDEGDAAAGGSEPGLGEVIGGLPQPAQPPVGPDPVLEAARQKPLDTGADPGDQGVLAEARAGLESGDPVTVAKVWEVLASPKVAVAIRQRIAQVAAEVRPEDPARAVAMLGDQNHFLHSREGRTAAERALGMSISLPDEQAIGLTSRLLGVCMRGPIEKGHAEAHACVDRIYAEHRKLAERWLCSPANLTRARSYKVKGGDTLGDIAGRFRKEGILIDDGVLAVLNRLHNPNALRVDQQIKVPTDPIFTVVEKRSFLMAVYVGDLILRLYWVGHGVDGKTPIAEFTIQEKLQDPDWYSPAGLIPFGDPKNILGRYFVKFGHPGFQGFGAHGTPQPETVGTMASDGCLRMHDGDIEDFFRVVPRGTKVLIQGS